MKYIKILLFLLFSNLVFAQSETPKEIFLGKWVNDQFGIEILNDRIVTLQKSNDWQASTKKGDTYYFKETIMNEDEIYVTWVENQAMFDYYKNGEWKKTTTKQFRVFKLEKNDDESIDLSMSEKKLEVEGLHKYASTNIIKEGEVFEKTFTLKKLNSGANH